MATCEDCNSPVTITLEPYGSGKMATIECPNCGVSYDTNLDPIEGESKCVCTDQPPYKECLEHSGY